MTPYYRQIEHVFSDTDVVRGTDNPVKDFGISEENGM